MEHSLIPVSTARYTIAVRIYRNYSQTITQQPKTEATMETKNDIRSKNPLRTFSFFSSPIRSIKPSGTFTLLDAFNYITGSRATHNTYQLRAIKDSDYAKKFKASHFDYCTFSGTFRYRNDKGIIQHSGLLCLDFDHLDNIEETRKILLNDRYFETQLLFISPSGDGLKWVVEIDIDKASHKDWFMSISNYLKCTYSLIADQQCKNISRACFLPYDHKCYINPQLLDNERI
jgi:hypothetical protein